MTLIKTSRSSYEVFIETSGTRSHLLPCTPVVSPLIARGQHKHSFLPLIPITCLDSRHMGLTPHFFAMQATLQSATITYHVTDCCLICQTSTNTLKIKFINRLLINNYCWIPNMTHNRLTNLQYGRNQKSTNIVLNAGYTLWNTVIYNNVTIKNSKIKKY